ncbi:MAG: hypothetical protein K1X57_12430 [Gemmataceae bacterium]|nr:hypothetical protein [Gemmataceae bacterium]
MTESTDRMNRLQSVLAELDGLPSRPAVVVSSPPPPPSADPIPAPVSVWVSRLKLFTDFMNVLGNTRKSVVSIIALVAGCLGIAYSTINRIHEAPVATGDRRGTLRNLAVIARTDPEAATQSAINSLNDSSSPEEFEAVAVVFANAAQARGDALLAEHRAARAVLYIRHALRHGLPRHVVETEPAFASLRTRADYRQIVGP